MVYKSFEVWILNCDSLLKLLNDGFAGFRDIPHHLDWELGFFFKFFTTHPQSEVPSNSKIAIPRGRCILTNTLLVWKLVMLSQYLQMGYHCNQWHLLVHLIYRKCMISKELWYLLILFLVYPNILQIIPGDDNYLLYLLLGENKWQYTSLYDIP
jgi:hypothetical protein